MSCETCLPSTASAKNSRSSWPTWRTRAARRGGTTTYADLLPGAYQDYLILEAWASRISAYEAQRIPALLQTPAYARALAEADPGLADNGARDRAAGATLARQKAILGERRPDIHVVIGEAALRQEVGGLAVMRGQLEMLARISGGSAVGAVQILPFTRGAHPAADVGSLAILQFSAAPRLGVAYLGGAGGGVLLEGQADLAAVRPHVRAAEGVRAQPRPVRAPAPGADGPVGPHAHGLCRRVRGRRHRPTTIQRPRRPAG